MTGDQTVFLDQTVNVCNIKSKISNIFIKKIYNIVKQHLKFPFECPFKKVGNLKSELNIIMSLVFSRDSMLFQALI